MESKINKKKIKKKQFILNDLLELILFKKKIIAQQKNKNLKQNSIDFILSNSYEKFRDLMTKYK